MYSETVEFRGKSPLSWETWQVGSYHRHCHEDVIEVLTVLRGKARVTVSFECFEMNQGDYVVIRERDSHGFEAIGPACEIASLYFRMDEYLEKIPHLYSVLFCCESFDLARYRNETAKIRSMILRTLSCLVGGNEEGRDEAARTAENLLWILVNDYDMVRYYNRNWNVPFHKIEKYYLITGYLFQWYHLKDPLDYISDKTHYSRSYLTHLFKAVGACSLKGALDYVRIFRSEEMLLSTDLSIHEISDRCGYSDIKYYTSSFKKWFLCTPSEYRKKATQEAAAPGSYARLTPAQLLDRINDLSRGDLEEPVYKAAVTPISLKLSGLLENISSPGLSEVGSIPDGWEQPAGEQSVPLRALCISISKEALEKKDDELLDFLYAFEHRNFVPVVVIDRRTMSALQARGAGERIAALTARRESPYEAIILYGEMGQFGEIQKLAEDMYAICRRLTVRPMFTG